MRKKTRGRVKDSLTHPGLPPLVGVGLLDVPQSGPGLQRIRLELGACKIHINEVVIYEEKVIYPHLRGHSQMTSEERGREGVAQILTQ